jgi:hypothetical protein
MLKKSFYTFILKSKKIKRKLRNQPLRIKQPVRRRTPSKVIRLEMWRQTVEEKVKKL